MIIDSHQHIWDPARADYPWLPTEPGGLNRAFGFEELRPTLRGLGVDASILVQSADDPRDTALMVEAAQRHPEIVAVVGWAPLDRPDELPEHLRALRASGLVVGIRSLVHEREPGWLATPAVDSGLGVLAAAGLTFDLVTSGPAALAELPAVTARHPELRIVIDHLGKPPVGAGDEARAAWRNLIAATARHPSTHVKLSGLYSAVGDMDAWTLDTIRPYFDDALELFGAERMMYGGDWPICLLAGGYERWWEAVTTLVEPLSPTERDAVLGGTAADFYRIPNEGEK